MNNQRKISVLLGFALFLTLCTPALATAKGASTPSDQAVTAPASPAPMILSDEGTVTEVGKTQVTIETQNKAYPVLTLNVTDKTIVMDNQTGLPTKIESLKKGDKIYSYFSAAMTRSIPPQSFAYAILTNITKENPLPANLHTVGTLDKNADGNTRILTSDGGLYITVLKDTPISVFGSDKSVSASDIKSGTDFFAWYGAVALSYPGQTTATKIVLLPSNILPSVKPVTELQINGKKLNEEIYKDNGNIMVPVRAVGEALGFTVKWNQADKSVSLDNGTVKTNITLGRDGYYKASSKAIGMTAPFELGSAPAIHNGKVYVPAEMFNILYSDDSSVSIADGVINITAK